MRYRRKVISKIPASFYKKALPTQTNKPTARTISPTNHGPAARAVYAKSRAAHPQNLRRTFAKTWLKPTNKKDRNRLPYFRPVPHFLGFYKLRLTIFRMPNSHYPTHIVKIGSDHSSQRSDRILPLAAINNRILHSLSIAFLSKIQKVSACNSIK